MKKTEKIKTLKAANVPEPGARDEHHHHHHDDKELYIIEADGNVKKVDLHREEEC